MTIRCSACGGENPSHATFCTACGVSLSGAPPQVPPPVPMYQGNSWDQGSSVPGVHPPQIPTYVEQTTYRNVPQESGLMGALSASWKLCATNRVMFWLVWFVYYLILMGAGMVPFVGQFVSLAVTGPLTLGLWKAVLNAYDGQQPDVGQMFTGFNSFVSGLLIYLTTFAPILIAMLIGGVIVMPKILAMSGSLQNWSPSPGNALPPGIMGLVPYFLLASIPMFFGGLFSIGFQFGYGFLVDNPGMEVGQAIGRAWELTKSNLGALFLMGLLSVLIAFACVVVIIVGWIFLFFVMGPVLQFWIILFYRSLTANH